MVKKMNLKNKMSNRDIIITSYNLLVEETAISEHKTVGGIVVPTESIKGEKSTFLSIGRVVNKGPSFMLPIPLTENDLSSIIDEKPTPIILNMDVEVGDLVHFSKNMSETTFIKGKMLEVVPYPAVKIIERDMGN
jgi:co-chaperonin GroES (HSP10)